MAAETRDETIAKLRARFGREPTDDEIRTGRNEAIRRAYAAMAVTEMMLRDEVEQHMATDGSEGQQREPD
ncbi:hypothetical protein JQ594_28440 [Bradyrhizobium manausense]|uniref:hypothetical protein n=1 Tax=Bradyrhizobium manausense TaxID=989370 RepID=UPI001BA83061|nr:hypothetical protein [Bradyrhizobium manausense]MBR0689871.1 hypothetical protein [Bradyrhizobium manausense]